VVRIKVCGLKRDVDISYVNELKVDYAGFVFAKSRRQVSLEEAKKLVDKLDSGIKRVGVFVNERAYEIQKAVEVLSLDIVQLHGEEDLGEYLGLDVDIWKAVRVSCKEDVERARLYKCPGVLFDAFVEGMYGGTGKVFDFGLIEKEELNSKVILAGGLNCNNVSLAIERVKPYAVDVSSGVETEGVKDFYKMKEFVKRVREYGKNFIQIW